MTDLIKSSTTFYMFDTLETNQKRCKLPVCDQWFQTLAQGIALTQACNTSWLPKTIAQGRTKPDSYRCKWRHASPSSPLLLALWIICICHSATRSHIGSPEYWINGSTILVSITFVPVFLPLWMCRSPNVSKFGTTYLWIYPMFGTDCKKYGVLRE